MAVYHIASIYDDLLNYLADKASPEDVLAFQASNEAEERAAYLTDRNNAGLLTPHEREELDQLLYFDRKVALLKARAALALNRETA